MGFFTKDIKSMEDLLLHGLQDIYYAEQQILKALPKMIDKATVSPKKANKMTGVYIAPPKRCSSCITRSLLNDIDNSSRL